MTVNSGRTRVSQPTVPVLDGTWLRPGDPGYDRARRVWNGMHDRRPAHIVRCASVADVRRALRFAAGAGYEVTVRGGGHNVAGTAVADGTLMVDLSLLRGVEVDPAARTARAQGGCLLGDLDAATEPHGLVCPTGIISRTGLAGLALGGGYGWLSRRWGLTCDHVLSAQVVLADGSVVEATERDHHELLWALRGGGGNFGIVTRFTLRLRPAVPVHRRTGVYELASAEQALANYRAFAGELSADLHVAGALKVAGQYGGYETWLPERLRGRPALYLTAVWFGAPERAEAASEPLFAALPPAAASSGPIGYRQLQSGGDHERPDGNRYYTKTRYLADVPAPAAAEMVDSLAAMPSPLSSINFEYLRGAIADVPDQDSAFPGRDAPFIHTVSAQWSRRAQDLENIAWTRRSVERLDPWSHTGAYVNYLVDERPDRVREVYGDARYRRLAAVKAAYDPGNALHHNQNIRPGQGNPE
ncbi:FAD/FMN-containing dehydrogenase [Streptomyces sp. 1114.5]|uniref:FAD-binding oxidoreductase n=1 Tax=Streptomyces sp. 1114.5 TaxID=1938830 RepID=UPI000EB0918D|nr:FAD-binding oxidoreductase [Streptomyces sp. 1114.5]RKT19035.1 FAD/FMN-containing dehydrogenase [Streptomyces sp. 1114.5]